MVPQFDKFIYPILSFIGDGREYRIPELCKMSVEFFHLSQADVEEKIAGGRQQKYYNRVQWATTYLQKAGLLIKPKKGVCVITDEGKRLLQTGVKEINPKYLKENYPSFARFAKGKKKDVESADLFFDEDCQHWWINANPIYFSFGDIKVGETVDYTFYNEKGNRRAFAKNFDETKVGDKVIGFESGKLKQVVCLLRISMIEEGQTLTLTKVADLETPIDWEMIAESCELEDDSEIFKMKRGERCLAQATLLKLTEDEYDIILGLADKDDDDEEVDDATQLKPYSKADFLSEVFMKEEDYERLKGLLVAKKNIILQGAPGVGKTFTAKRLAFSILGVVDEEKVEMVQFHQNYSYEDFIMGYKPTEESGFALKEGVFYRFCKKAESDPEGRYFFIIDEINRGNMSKVFGELLMLIEKDYRGAEIRLAYRGERFSVPENVFLIGMMNTADRSLAMIDYALRRRFSFFPMKPGFESEGFRKMQSNISNEKFDKIIDAIKSLNDSIEKELGAGFCIGHSYFCLEETETFDEAWLVNVIDYDIEPMLNEYWFDDKDMCNQEIKKLKSILG